MSKRRAVILLVTVVSLYGATFASAQPVWGHERYPNSGA